MCALSQGFHGGMLYFIIEIRGTKMSYIIVIAIQILWLKLQWYWLRFNLLLPYSQVIKNRIKERMELLEMTSGRF
jgi:hypothetical protein